jgi:phosphoglycolate phosphatase
LDAALLRGRVRSVRANRTAGGIKALRLENIIFDFDGTVADSFETTLGILNSLADEFGYRPAEPHEVQELRGLSYREIGRRLGVSLHTIPFIAARVRRELARSMAGIRPFEALPEVLAQLRESGLSLGIMTSNSRRNVETFLAANEIDDFEFISTATNVWGKQRALKRLLRRRGLSIGATAYVGDETRDIEACKALDIEVVAVSWGYTLATQLSTQRPDRLIDHPSQLLDLID